MSDVERSLYCWVTETNEDFAEISELPAQLEEHFWKLTNGVSSKDWFPDDIVFDLDPNEGIRLADAIPNALLLKVVSEKLKSVLETHCVHCEYYPVQLRNPRGKVVKRPYYVANLLSSIDGLDKKSLFRPSALYPSQATNIDKLVLNAAAHESRLPLFRLAEYPYLWVATKEVALDIRKTHGCDGLRFVPAAKYSSLRYS